MRFLIGFILSCLLLSSCFIRKKNGTAKNIIELNPIEITSGKKSIETFHINPPKEIDLLHIDLNISFNFEKKRCFGTEHITFKPCANTCDSFYLDAKGFEFHRVELFVNNDKWEFKQFYDGNRIGIKCLNPLSQKDEIKLTLDYTASPGRKGSSGSQAIQNDKGLYFINTNHNEPNKPFQVWTQGETEANSNWFATIDKPYEKMSFDIKIKVPDSLNTLSNGELIKSISEAEHQKTDHWRMEQEMSSYLVMIAIGTFQETKRIWNEKEISYYLEPAFHPYADKIFEHTPEMVDFFSKRLQVPYPWNKYAQIVVRDYISGAMENTTATLHGARVQKNRRELIDNPNDNIIAHELFHQWFGDLVTCESWSHLTLNEGFAVFGEQLWHEYKYGKSSADNKIWTGLQAYLNFAKKQDGPLIEFYYNDKEDMFNSITYQKGGRVLNLLRHELGDEVFFKGLQKYLTRYAFKVADIHDLRKAMEECSGRDLNAFFYQWYLNGGHPELDIYLQKESEEFIIHAHQIQESQSLPYFDLPLTYRIMIGGKETYVHCRADEVYSSYRISYPDSTIPVLIYPDPDGLIIGEIHQRISENEYMDYVLNAKTFIEKARLISDIPKDLSNRNLKQDVIAHFLKDKDPNITLMALRQIDISNVESIRSLRPQINKIASLPGNGHPRAYAIRLLGGLEDNSLMTPFLEWTQDSSYAVAGAALYAVSKLKPQEALRLCKKLNLDAESDLRRSISDIYAKYADATETYFHDHLLTLFERERVQHIADYTGFVLKQNNDELNEVFWMDIIDRARNDEYDAIRRSAYKALYQWMEKQKKNNKDIETKEEEFYQALKNEPNKSNLDALSISGIKIR